MATYLLTQGREEVCFPRCSVRLPTRRYVGAKLRERQNQAARTAPRYAPCIRMSDSPTKRSHGPLPDGGQDAGPSKPRCPQLQHRLPAEGPLSRQEDMGKICVGALPKSEEDFRDYGRFFEGGKGGPRMGHSLLTPSRERLGACKGEETW